MRVCIDISPLSQTKITGIGEYLLGLLNSFNRKEITKLTLFGIVPATFDLDIYIEMGISKHLEKIILRYPTKLTKQTLLLWQRLNWPYIESLIGKSHDIYHVFDWYTPPSRNVPVVSTVYDLTIYSYEHLHKPSNVLLQSRRLERLNAAKGIVFISKYTKQKYIERFGMSSVQKSVVAYPGIKKAFYGIDTNRFNYEQKSPYILVVSTKEPRKNLLTIINAFNLTKHNHEYKLVIVGASGWGDEFLIQNERIHILDYVDNSILKSLYQNCAFTIYIPKEEGFGLPVIESLFFGKNVITGDHSSLSEARGHFGKVVKDVEDVYEISRKIMEMINSDEKCNVNSRIQYAQTYNYNKSAERIIEMYTQILR